MPIKDPKKRAAYQKGYHEKWYSSNRGERIQQVAKRKRGIREWMRVLKESLSCERCGLSGVDNAWALEFHHIDPQSKTSLISTMVASGMSKKKISEEIDKCEIICSNCHRKEHYEEHRAAVEKGEDSIWIAAGRAGAANETFSNDNLTRQKKRRRKRRKQRLLEQAGGGKAGPNRKVNDDIDTLLYKMENGSSLDKNEVDRLRRLIARSGDPTKQMEGEAESDFKSNGKSVE